MYTKTEEKPSPGSGLGVCIMYTKTEEKPSPGSRIRRMYNVY